jgi:hypothetical protein
MIEICGIKRLKDPMLAVAASTAAMDGPIGLLIGAYSSAKCYFTVR